MGAKAFDTIGIGATVDDAFNQAVADASQIHGIGNESGTIVEKVGCGLLEHVLLPGETADSVVDAWRHRPEGHRSYEKYDPTFYINLGDSRWRFFGYAAY